MIAKGARFARLGSAAVLAALVCAAAGAAAGASDQAMAVTLFSATIRTYTSLRLSDQVLTIAPRLAGDEGPLQAGSIEFRAAARTSTDGEVILTVEPIAPLASVTGGAADEATTIAFEGSGDGAQNGVLADGRPEMAARWMGSGLRTGRLAFTVHGPVAPQGATLPLRFVLSAP